MLSNVVPGLREIRAAVAAGVLWLLAIALLMHDSFPPRQQASGLYATAYDLHDLLSGVGFGAAVSFAAYLLGTLSFALLVGGFPDGRLWRSQVSFLPRALRLPGRHRGRPRRSLRAPFGDRGYRILKASARDTVDRLRPVIAALADAHFAEADVREKASERFPRVWHGSIEHLALQRMAWSERAELRRRDSEAAAFSDIDKLLKDTGELSTVLKSALVRYWRLGPEPNYVPVRRPLVRKPTGPPQRSRVVENPARSVIEEAVADLIVADFDLMRTRLLHPETLDLSSAIDRLRSEAELRAGVTAPLAGLLVVFVAETHMFVCLAGLCGVIVLFHEALRRRRESGDMLLDALEDRVKSPALERLDSDVARVVEGLRSRRSSRQELDGKM
jgi:hypothetical protein